MGIVEYKISNLIQKVGSWMSSMPDACQESVVSSAGGDRAVCGGCREGLGSSPGRAHRCRSCGQMFCANRMQNGGGSSGPPPELDQVVGQQQSLTMPMFCKACFRVITGSPEAAERCGSDDVSPLASPERVTRSLASRRSTEKLDTLATRQQFSSPRPLRCSAYRNFDEDEGDEYGMNYFTPTSEFSLYSSDIDSMSISTANEFYNLRSMNSSPFDSPYRPVSPFPAKSNFVDQGSPGDLLKSTVDLDDFVVNTSECTYDLSINPDQIGQRNQEELLDFQNNGRIWYPPPPEDMRDDEETDFFGFDDEDDDVGDSGKQFRSINFGDDVVKMKEKTIETHKDVLRSAVHGHFRALVSQLLRAEGVVKENEGHEWLDVVSSLAWQAAEYVRPDTTKGGSMDPGDYLKVKCVTSSGRPRESTLVKGVVCSKNVKHKRMISQHRSPRLLILGGPLEYQRTPNEFASMNALLFREKDHINATLGKIEALRPNVLLVEKSVSSYAQERLLGKNEISLVQNIKRSLLERIAQCTGAQIASSLDSISSARLGHCEVFRIEKVHEESPPSNSFKKKCSKTLMFFEGCPRRLGCTILLRGASHNILKKIKHAVQYASFAAYHLSLETSFLADEGATLPKIPLGPPTALTKKLTSGINNISTASGFLVNNHQTVDKDHLLDKSCKLSEEHAIYDVMLKNVTSEDSFKQQGHTYLFDHRSNYCNGVGFPSAYSQENRDYDLRPQPDIDFSQYGSVQCEGQSWQSSLSSGVFNNQSVAQEKSAVEKSTSADDRLLLLEDDHKKTNTGYRNEIPREYLSAADNHQSILVSLSSTCIPKGTVCVRSQLFRIKFYGSFDKPLGRYLRDDLFNKTYCCQYCKEPTEAHVRCYTHQHGSLSISVNRLSSMKLPGENDGRIWMWHRCLKCAMEDGVPPAVHRVIMSDAAWGLSFGKFLELSFSNHATANRVAGCGHSLQRDCLRFYGFGNMVAFFRYSPVDILSVYLPPAVLDFNNQLPKEWVRQETASIHEKIDLLHVEVSNLIQSIKKKITTFEHDELLKVSVQRQVTQLEDMLRMAINHYDFRLQKVTRENVKAADILELNHLRRSLLLDSYMWDDQLHFLDSFCNEKHSDIVDLPLPELIFRDGKFGDAPEVMNTQLLTSGTHQQLGLSKQYELSFPVFESSANSMIDMNLSTESTEGYACTTVLSFASQPGKHWHELQGDDKCTNIHLEGITLPVSSLSEKIDSAWTGSGQLLRDQAKSGPETDPHSHLSIIDDPHHRRIRSPIRVYSFDSALRLRKRVRGGLFPPSHLTSFNSFDSSGDLPSMTKDPSPNMRRAYSQGSPRTLRRSNVLNNRTPAYITSALRMVNDGVRLLLPPSGINDIAVAVYDDEPASIISYALASEEYMDYIASKSHHPRDANGNIGNLCGHSSASFGTEQSLTRFLSENGSDEFHRPQRSFSDSKETHFKMSFDDESSFLAVKAKFSITCYFAKQFDVLRKQCCPNDMDYICSLSRCKRWQAQGGKSNVYFAKSLDERFIIKQVPRTELDSFEDFAPEYFKYLSESISSGSPTCLAKILGIYQVTSKHLKGGREMKMDLMVMENLLYKRRVSRVYDLKGSQRSRYNPNTSGNNKVLLDMNLVETIGTRPIFLGSKAKRRLERAIWNDTSFLASIHVMDYSLLVGVDEDQKELVVGIIDFMRQYTWDKHLETWVKASGILGGQKNASPTVVSPLQYKKRFRKAMSNYFLTVPDQWST